MFGTPSHSRGANGAIRTVGRRGAPDRGFRVVSISLMVKESALRCMATIAAALSAAASSIARASPSPGAGSDARCSNSRRNGRWVRNAHRHYRLNHPIGHQRQRDRFVTVEHTAGVLPAPVRPARVLAIAVLGGAAPERR